MINSVVIPPYFFCDFSIIPYVFIKSHRYLFLDFSLISNVFTDIDGYENKLVCILDHRVKGTMSEHQFCTNF